jgi:hypothetical protein
LTVVEKKSVVVMREKLRGVGGLDIFPNRRKVPSISG